MGFGRRGRRGGFPGAFGETEREKRFQVNITPTTVIEVVPSEIEAINVIAAEYVLIGNPAAQNVLITPDNGIQLRDGESVHTAVASSIVTIGDTSAEHVLIDSDSLDIKDGATVLASFNADSSSVGQTSSEHIFLDANGLTIKQASTNKVRIEPDGDVFIGRNLGLVTGVAIAIFTNAQTYNGEAVGSNDLMIGSNDGTQPNLFWDDSLGEFSLRRGTQKQIELDGTQILVGDAAAEHIRITPTSGFQIKNGTAVHAELDDDALRIGPSATENILITPTGGFKLREGTTIHAQLSSSQLRIGPSTDENILMSVAGGLKFRNGTTVYGQLDDNSLTLGQTTDNNVYITPGSLKFRNSGTTYAKLDVDELVLGATSDTNIRITPASGFQLREGSTVHAELDSDALRIGPSASENILITPTGGFKLREGTTVHAELSGSQLRIGPTSGENILISASGGFKIREGTTVHTELSDSKLKIGESSANHIVIDTGKLQFKDGSTVLFEMDADTFDVQNTGTISSGNVIIDVGEVSIEASPDLGTYRDRGFIFRSTTNVEVSGLYGVYTSGLNEIELNVFQKTGREGQLDLYAGAPSGKKAEVNMAVGQNNDAKEAGITIRIVSGATAQANIDADETTIHNDVWMPTIPTSDPLSAGQLWNSSGTLKVSAG